MNYYVGLSLASSSGMDSGVAVIDEDNRIITLDKLYKMNDVIHFFENFPSLNNSKICASIPLDRTMLEGKWRILGKQYQPVMTNKIIPNRDNWTQRLSTRGCEYFHELEQRGIEVTRFDIYMTRQSMHLNSCYKDRSPADCKFLQQALRYEWGFDELGSNMLPMSHLEAVIGALLAKENECHPEKIRSLFDFKGFRVIDLKDNINNSSEIFKFEQELLGAVV